MAGYSGTPLIQKLGLKDSMRVRFMNVPADYEQWLGTMPEIRKVRSAPYHFVHLFTNRISELEQTLAKVRNELDDKGMVWVSWYKKASGKPSEITEDIIRDTALALGFVDVKVCAVNTDWSALKLVIRVENRGKSS